MSMTGFPVSILLRAINHVLSREPWAMARLAQFSGKVAQIVSPPVDFVFTIAPDGTLHSVDNVGATPLVAITLPQDTLVKSVSGQFSEVLSAAKISGSVEFAEALSFVFKNIRWDIEADLSAVIGEIAAWRGMQAMRQGFAWQRNAALNLLENAKEYLVEESRQVVAERDIHSFSVSVTELRDDLARLEKRLARL